MAKRRWGKKHTAPRFSKKWRKRHRIFRGERKNSRGENSNARGEKKILLDVIEIISKRIFANSSPVCHNVSKHLHFLLEKHHQLKIKTYICTRIPLCAPASAAGIKPTPSGPKRPPKRRAAQGSVLLFLRNGQCESLSCGMSNCTVPALLPVPVRFIVTPLMPTRRNCRRKPYTL